MLLRLLAPCLLRAAGEILGRPAQGLRAALQLIGRLLVPVRSFLRLPLLPALGGGHRLFTSLAGSIARFIHVS